MHGQFDPINRTGTLNPHSLRRMGEQQYAWSNATTPFWQSFQVTSSGVQLVDQKPKEILAIIGSAGSGSGLGSGSDPIPANDQLNAYEWVEGYWKVVNDDLVVEALVDGRFGTLSAYPAIERNGVTDVPDGYITYIRPAFAEGVWFYEFEYNGEVGTGSGNDETLVVDCGDGSTATYTIARTDDGYSATLVE